MLRKSGVLQGRRSIQIDFASARTACVTMCGRCEVEEQRATTLCSERALDSCFCCWCKKFSPCWPEFVGSANRNTFTKNGDATELARRALSVNGLRWVARHTLTEADLSPALASKHEKTRTLRSI